MKKINYFPLLCSLIPSVLILPLSGDRAIAQTELCPNSIWSRMEEYTIQSNDTLEAIADRYNLVTETLIRVNPNLNTPPLSGKNIKIPPFNGMIINPPSGATWQDLASNYGVRADVLFELNGCNSVSTRVFIPGITWTSNYSFSEPNREIRENNQATISFYPLTQPAQIGLNYGWLINPENGESFFHSGVDLLAQVAQPVQATEDGIVAFAGVQGNYGNLIVINHQDGKQTRYAHLQQIKVMVGETIEGGQIIGLVGTTGTGDIELTHLHFEVRLSSPQGWVAQDPLLYLNNK